MAFWQAKCGVDDAESGKEAISAGYFRSIRNYYRFGWVIPYLFGASPAICSSFLQGKPTTPPFESGKWHVLPALCDLAAPERSGLYQ